MKVKKNVEKSQILNFIPLWTKLMNTQQLKVQLVIIAAVVAPNYLTICIIGVLIAGLNL